MKDFFGTEIFPGDAVVVARGAFAGNAGQLELFTAVATVKGDGLTLMDKNGRRRSFAFREDNCVAVKSVRK